MENDMVLKGNAVGLATGHGGAVRIEADSTFTMTNGTITGASAPNGYGGAVYGAKNSTFIMKGGIITGNQAQYGAGVYIVDGTLTMSGGSIEDNGDGGALVGGGICITGSTQPALFTMSGGTITGNIAGGGGGVALQGNPTFIDFTMDGGTIAGNQASGYGGGVRVAFTATFTMNGGVISDNTAGNSGGGVSLIRAGSKFIMNGGTILGNTSLEIGGGVCADTIYGGAPIFTMMGGTIAENRAWDTGGGVYIQNGGVFTKEPPSPDAASGVIYGYDPANSSSNRVQSALGIEDDKGHAVYVSAAKRREATVLPQQHLDSGSSAGWAE
jgi:hypothetical protein